MENLGWLILDETVGKIKWGHFRRPLLDPGQEFKYVLRTLGVVKSLDVGE